MKQVSVGLLLRKPTGMVLAKISPIREIPSNMLEHRVSVPSMPYVVYWGFHVDIWGVVDVYGRFFACIFCIWGGGARLQDPLQHARSVSVFWGFTVRGLC